MRPDCVSVTASLLDEATQKFSPQFVENAEYRDILLDYCSAFDTIMGAIDCTSFTVEVGEDDMTVSVSLGINYAEIVSEGVVVELGDKMFAALMERAVSMEFSKGEGDTSIVKFTFPSIWEEAERKGV